MCIYFATHGKNDFSFVLLRDSGFGWRMLLVQCVQRIINNQYNDVGMSACFQYAAYSLIQANYLILALLSNTLIQT